MCNARGLVDLSAGGVVGDQNIISPSAPPEMSREVPLASGTIKTHLMKSVCPAKNIGDVVELVGLSSVGNRQTFLSQQPAKSDLVGGFVHIEVKGAAGPLNVFSTSPFSRDTRLTEAAASATNTLPSFQGSDCKASSFEGNLIGLPFLFLDFCALRVSASREELPQFCR